MIIHSCVNPIWVAAMLKISLALVIVCAIAAPSISQSVWTDPRDLNFVRLTDDIHVAFRPEPLRYWVEGNVTIILNDEDVVVVDGSGSNRSARQVIDYISPRRAPSGPLRRGDPGA